MEVEHDQRHGIRALHVWIGSVFWSVLGSFNLGLDSTVLQLVWPDKNCQAFFGCVLGYTGIFQLCEKMPFGCMV